MAAWPDGQSEVFGVHIMTPETGVLRALRSIEAAAILVASAACVTAPTRPTPPPPGPETRVFVYPMRDQPADLQDRDRYECHNWPIQQTGFDPSAPWALGQTGFDPTAPGGVVAAGEAAQKRNDYFRAEAGCLEGRGYTVR